jgi:hypothetical protein
VTARGGEDPELLARFVLYAIAFAPAFVSLGIPEVPSALAGVGLGLVAARIADTFACDAECKERSRQKRHEELVRAMEQRE